MDFWPFLCIFVSLILILFFRRIDKRTINFNKFKRYAQKLSEDFNLFLSQKKEDLSGSLLDLDSAIKKASQMLVRIEMTGDSLKSSVISLKGEKNELDNIKHELEKLKRIKEDITSEITDIQKNLPPLKKLSKRIKKMDMEIAVNEKSLKNAFSMLPALEQRFQERTESAL